MRCFRFASIVAIFTLSACSRYPYRDLEATRPVQGSILSLKPKVSRELYRCVVDGQLLWKKFHLSGILLFKQLPDGSLRAIFQNELGVSFFDFEWDARDSFSVKSIMSQLDRPAIIKTLKTDLSMLLMKGLKADEERALIADGDTVFRFPMNDAFVYYRQINGRIPRIEYAGRSLITSVGLTGQDKTSTLPDSITFDHRKANFSIELKKINPDEQ